MRAGAAGTVAALALGATLVLAVFRGGGSGDAELVPVAGVALLVAGGVAAACALGRAPLLRVGRTGGALIGLGAAYVAWLGLSIAWSVAPDRSWDAFNRGLAYLALLLLGVLVGGLVRQAPMLLARALAAIVAVAVVWALAGKAVPALGPDDIGRSARLRSPVGYWNALALLIATGLPLYLSLAADRARLAVRALAAPALTGSLVALALTASRGGMLVAAVAVGAWLLLAPARLEGALALAAAAPFAAAVGAWTLTLPGVADAGVAESTRRSDGARFGVVLAVALVLSYDAARLLLRRVPGEGKARRRLGRLLAGAAGVCAVLALVAGAVRVGDPVAWAGDRFDEFRNPPNVQVPQNPGERIGSFSSNNRWTWWKESWWIWEDHRLGGAGAGSFELARRPLREDTQVPLAPHDLPLQALAETGLVGLLLLLGAAVAAVLVVRDALRRLDGASRAAAAALAAGLCAWAAHSLVDMGWQYVAVSAPFFAALGVLVTAGRPAERAERRAPLVALAAVGLALAAVASLAAPWLADRRLDDAYDEFARADLVRAGDDAHAAQRLNPLDVAPLQVRAALAEAEGRQRDAERFLRDAVELQPENPDTWFELARFEFAVKNDVAGAYCHLDRAYALDSWDDDTARLLNDVRAAGATGVPCA